ncbi:uncharacterized protein An08g06820 [Aspergillus niger]|uniref:Contig An08c0150, genomic contig n=2 Tax=Aspergillus niger TaxID=5061 RepID=A2QRQ1_ASPNC|nr:uncharacterized protein An08g06820 [Aspergillus niger]CAK45652.1 unnamed protein product [Aspergillus niger]
MSQIIINNMYVAITTQLARSFVWGFDMEVKYILSVGG